MLYSRRQFGALTLVGLPVTAWALANLPLSVAGVAKCFQFVKDALA